MSGIEPEIQRRAFLFNNFRFSKDCEKCSHMVKEDYLGCFCYFHKNKGQPLPCMEIKWCEKLGRLLNWETENNLPNYLKK
ncbi:MAG: hypothetical protein ACTSVI_07530 [Promethearchaeota archaeon]